MSQAVDGASLAAFRICFGLVIVWHALRYLLPTAGGTNLIHRYFVEPVWNFPYHGLEWVQRLPEPWMTILFITLGLAGLLLALGIFCRASAATVFIIFTYVFLLDATRYLNHYYLMLLLAFLLIWMPADACFSLATWIRRHRRGEQPSDGYIPFWPVFLLRAQLFILYFYAGIAKMNPDWIAGRAVWDAAYRVQDAVFGIAGSQKEAALRVLLDHELLGQMIAIGGLAFDLAIGFMLLVRRTRILAIILVLMFHAFNSQTFHIGVFPILAFAATLIFFDVDWPRRAWRWIKRPRISTPDVRWLLGGAVLVPVIGAALGWKLKCKPPQESRPGFALPGLLLSFLVLWISFHIAWPLRHLAIPGDAQWTDEGHYFAWRMMLRDKTGFVRLGVFDSGLFQTDSQGRMQIASEEWTRRYPKLLHIDIDACAIDWHTLPELVVIYDPLVGERIVVNRLARDAVVGSDSDSSIERDWRHLYGRAPQLVRSVSLGTACTRLGRQLARSGSRDTHSAESMDLLITAARDAQKLAAEKPTSVFEQESRAVALNDVLSFMLSSKEYGKLVQQHLARVHPFVLQGRPDDGTEFTLLEDVLLQQVDRHNREMIDRAQWKGTHVVHLDMKRLRESGWSSLPRAILHHDNGRLHVSWNYFAELERFQIMKFKTRPYMIHQYAQRIADVWEQDFGRRPQVYADTCLVSLNNRALAPIIDPAVDLASVPMMLFSHNSWILPSPRKEMPDSNPRVEVNQAGQLVAFTAFPNGRTWTEKRVRREVGHQYGTVSTWYENGQLSMRAAYRDGHQHGGAKQWYRNGQLATHVSYVEGQRHDVATTWYMNGQMSWQARYLQGRLDGSTTAWCADGRIVTQRESDEEYSQNAQPARQVAHQIPVPDAVQQR